LKYEKASLQVLGEIQQYNTQLQGMQKFKENNQIQNGSVRGNENGNGEET